MPTLVLVMLGGALGAGARYLLSQAALTAAGPGFPWGTLSANVIGGFLMGLLIGSPFAASQPATAFLAFGVLGGFTTFSSFSIETIRLIESGAVGPALGYVAASLVGAIGACAGGLFLARSVSA
ncbi:MAG: fluoride efflux transporter FluC [Caulobacterales bacterium]|jgi:CrcB protein